ncbi:MAG: OmpA family protein, partial [Bacteroidia bacterium]
MNLKSWLILILFFIWGVFCWQWYSCRIKGFCILDTISLEEDEIQPYDPPFTFSKSSFVCIKGKGLQNYIDSLKKLMKDGKSVTITGLYDSSETNKSTFHNLGLARANRIKSLLSAALDTSKIFTQSKLSSISMPQAPFIAHITDIEINENAEPEEFETQTIIREDNKPDKKPTPVSNKPVASNPQKVENDYIINFEPNSIKRAPSSEIDNYLNSMAEKLKESGKKLTITGHTDNTEDEKLDRIRAWVIKSELMERGVNPTQLITKGKGQNEP